MRPAIRIDSTLVGPQHTRQQARMSRILKVGVIGAGTFAGYHAAKAAVHPRARLIGVFDRRLDAAEAVAERHGGQAFSACEVLCETCDAVIIAPIAHAHKRMADIAIAAGCHLLIEKPLAPTAEDASLISEAAKREDLILQVGHQERVVMSAIGLDRIEEKPLLINAVRTMGRTSRNLDVSVVMDLMVHDLDLALWLMGSDPTNLNSELSRTYSDFTDTAKATVTFDSDARVHLYASRDAEPSRKLSLHYPSGEITIDFLSRTIANTSSHSLNKDIEASLSNLDSLAVAFDCFVKACLDGTPPLVSGKEGHAAVKLAEQIEHGHL